MTYPKSSDDEQRVRFLRDLSVLDTSRDENLDRITRLCQLIFDVEISTVSLIDEDRQWFKSFQGLDVCETDRDLAFCNYTIMSTQIFEVLDATQHPDFRDNLLVTGEPWIKYYAGYPLVFDGVTIGALCLIDTSPRKALDERERAILGELAADVIHEMQVARLLRRTLSQLVGR